MTFCEMVTRSGFGFALVTHWSNSKFCCEVVKLQKNVEGFASEVAAGKRANARCEDEVHRFPVVSPGYVLAK